MFSLQQTLLAIDSAVCEYNVGHVRRFWPADAQLKFFSGILLPCSITLSKPFAVETEIYVQEWHCCGKYNCSTGNGKDSGRRRCGAIALLTITALANSTNLFFVQFTEPDDIDHGEKFRKPEKCMRSLYQTKPILARAALRGESYGQMMQHIESSLQPRTLNQIKAFRRRFENQSKRKPALTPPIVPVKRSCDEIDAAIGMMAMYFQEQKKRRV